MPFLVATNVVASRPPERRPTGMPYAKKMFQVICSVKIARFINIFLLVRV